MNRRHFIEEAVSTIKRVTDPFYVLEKPKEIVTESGFDEDDSEFIDGEDYFDEIDLKPGERLFAEIENVRFIENFDTIGNLVLTNKRIIYRPRWYEVAREEDDISFYLADISDMDILNGTVKIKYNVATNQKAIKVRQRKKVRDKKPQTLQITITKNRVQSFHFVATTSEIQSFIQIMRRMIKR